MNALNRILDTLQFTFFDISIQKAQKPANRHQRTLEVVADRREQELFHPLRGSLRVERALLRRGDVTAPGEIVAPAALSAIGAPAASSARR